MNDSQKACETTTEWGIRWDVIEFEVCEDESAARGSRQPVPVRSPAHVPAGTRGPWTEVTV